MNTIQKCLHFSIKTEDLKQSRFFIVFTCIICFILTQVAIYPTIDNDTWFMMNHGRYILNNGFTTIEPFTIHEGLYFTFQKWLCCILYWKAYDLFGVYGPLIIVRITAALISIIFFVFIYNKSKKRIWLTLIISFLSSITINFFYMKSRPQIFSALFLLLELYILEKWKENHKHRLLFYIPLISLIFIQLHSTMWFIQFLFMLPYLVDFKIENLKLEYKSYHRLSIFLTMVVSFLVGFINPYGAESVFYFFKAIQNSDVNYLPIETQPPGTVISCIIMFVLCLFIGIMIYNKHIEGRYLCLLCGTAILSFMMARNCLYFVICLGFIFVSISDKLLELIKNNVQEILFIIILSFSGAIFCTPPLSDVDVYQDTVSYESINYLSEIVDSNDKIFTTYNNGAYAEFMGMKSYADPRGEVFIYEINKKENILHEINQLFAGQIHYQALQDKYDFSYWICDNYCPFEIYMEKDNNYQLVESNSQSRIYTYVGE